LLSIDAFRQLAGPNETLIDQLAMDDPARFEPDWRMIRGWAN
jgi:hypothetical protein